MAHHLNTSIFVFQQFSLLDQIIHEFAELDESFLGKLLMHSESLNDLVKIYED
jgi:hypothetical protein